MAKIDNYSHNNPAVTIELEHLTSHDSIAYLIGLQRRYQNTQSYKLAGGLAKFALVDTNLKTTNNTFVGLAGMALGIRFEEEVRDESWDNHLATVLHTDMADTLPLLERGETVSPFSERAAFLEDLTNRSNQALRADTSGAQVAYAIAHDLYSNNRAYKHTFLLGYGAIRAIAQ